MGSRYPHSSGERSELADRVVRVNRVAKVVKGGRKFSFSALIVVGDMNGRVGAGIGKAREVTEAIRKGMEVAKRNMITVPMVGTTIPHEVRLKLGSAKIMLKPAAPGTGVISATNGVPGPVPRGNLTAAGPGRVVAVNNICRHSFSSAGAMIVMLGIHRMNVRS